MAINKKMTIEEILRTDYGIANILMESGMHCLGCVMASGEDLEQACGVHGIDCDALVEKSTHTSKTNNLPNNLSEIASNFFDYANCTPPSAKSRQG